jgi:hypothetical protein
VLQEQLEIQQQQLTSDGATVTNSSDYVAWGEAASGDLVLDPGMWSLDNFGDKAICLIHEVQVFEWDSNATNATSTRATIISGAPTASRHMLVSTPDRHLVFLEQKQLLETHQHKMICLLDSRIKKI